MKNLKKLAGLLLALVLIMSLTTTAFAADTTYNISRAVGDTHSYSIYQIFTGDLAEDNKTLSNIKWGTNGTDKAGEAVGKTILDELAGVATGKTDKEKLEVIEKYAKLDNAAFKTIDDTTTSVTVPAGYYLIKDTNALTGDDTATLYIVKIVGSVTIERKAEKPTSEKKVQDVNDSTGDKSEWQDSADWDIGDDVPFKLKATLPEDFHNYSIYNLTFHDKQSDGLDAPTLFKVYVTPKDGSRTELDSKYWEVVTDKTHNDCTFEIKMKDMKAENAPFADETVIEVEYTAKLNNNAVIGSVGNPNTSWITYSNNPNDEQGGENGKTPDDTVIVFTFKTLINKTHKNPDFDPEDGNSKEYLPLEGAEFKLEKYNSTAKSWGEVGTITNTEGNLTTFEFEGLDDGWYRITETKTPDGYNTIAPIYFKIEATHDVTADDPKLTVLTAYETNAEGNKIDNDLAFTTIELEGTANLPAGTVSVDVLNQKGALLPETGGIGTTIFYIVGGLLMVGAAVLLVTKKRMGSAE